MDYTLIASLCAGVSASLLAWVIIDFVLEAKVRYQERFLKEAAVEMDEVLILMPAERILDVSLALSGVAAMLVLGGLAISSGPAPESQGSGVMAQVSWSWPKAIMLGALAAGLTFPVPRFYLRYLRKRRLTKFNEQLVDALGSMASALKAGFSINQAIEAVVEMNINPVSEEFRMLVQEIRLGVPLDDALQKMSNRLGSDDFELVAAAIITARQTGGELTVVFDRLASMIRERLRINGKLQALTAQGRLQAYVIGAMPYLLLFAMSYVAPGMTNAFYSSVPGLLVVGVISVLVVIGFLLIKKITTIDV